MRRRPRRQAGQKTRWASFSDCSPNFSRRLLGTCLSRIFCTQGFDNAEQSDHASANQYDSRQQPPCSKNDAESELQGDQSENDNLFSKPDHRDDQTSSSIQCELTVTGICFSVTFSRAGPAASAFSNMYSRRMTFSARGFNIQHGWDRRCLFVVWISCGLRNLGDFLQSNLRRCGLQGQ